MICIIYFFSFYSLITSYSCPYILHYLFFSFSCSHFFLFLLIKRFFFINFVNLSTLFTPFFDFDYGFWFLVPWLWHFFFWRVRWWDGMENGIERLVITPLTASLSGCLRRAVCMYVDSLHSTCSRDW